MKNFIDRFIRSIDRAISSSFGKQLIFFTAAVIIVFLFLFSLLVWLYHPQDNAKGFNIEFVNMLYSFFDISSFWNTGNVEKSFLVMIIAGFLSRVLFVGIMVSIITNAILHRINRVKNGEIYYSFKNHYVVIGFDQTCKGLIEQLLLQHDVVLQTSMDVQMVRHEIFSGLDSRSRKKITFVSGTRMSLEDVCKLKIEKCVQVFILGDLNEDNHDSQNIKCLDNINNIASKYNKNIRCHVLFNHQLTFSAFQRHELSGIRKNIDFVPYNFYDMWAQKIFIENSYNNGEIRYSPLERQPITPDSNMRVHLTILGMSYFGISMGLQAAHICHFPNFITKGIKTKITFIDENADRKLNMLKRQFNNFLDETDYSYKSFIDNNQYIKKSANNITDIEFEFVKGYFEDDTVHNYIKEAALQKDNFLTIAVCLRESSEALSAALYLPQVVYDSDISVLVRQKYPSTVISMLSLQDKDSLYCKYRNLRPFGMLNNSYNLKHSDDLLPMMVKYVYDNTTDAQTIKDFPEDKIRNNWLYNWKNTDNLCALKESNRYAANFIPVKQRSLDIKEGIEMTREQINYSAQLEHNRWIAEKLIFGYRAPLQEEISSLESGKKREYYKAHFIHEDLKAYNQLGKDDKNVSVINYDINISRAVPYMLKAYKEITKRS